MYRLNVTNRLTGNSLSITNMKSMKEAEEYFNLYFNKDYDYTITKEEIDHETIDI
mgnify:CR=1 FL=1